MRKLFELLSVCDFFSPIGGLVNDLATDPLQTKHCTIFFDYTNQISKGWNPKDIKKLLHDNGFRPSEPQIVTTPGGMQFHITLPIEYEISARELLALNGII